MASLQQRRWSGEVAGPSRRDRRPCAYEVYLPDLLQGRRFSLDGDVAAEVTRTETALIRLDATGNALANSEALARLLLRAESVASSRIEGLEIGGRRMLRADAAQRLGMEPRDVTSREVLGNIDAMTWAVDSVRPGGDITLESLLETHRRLLAGTRLKDHGGSVRTVQNWIGGSDYNPCSASFVPPPPEDVPGLLDDLMGFCNDDSLPALAQAAVAHAQFETIHPFVDGNGRAGRALVHMVLRRRGSGTADTAAGLPHPGDMVTGLHRRTERDTPRRFIQLRRGERRHQQLDRALRLCVQPVGGGCRSFRGPGARAAVRLEGTGGAHPPRLRGQSSDRRSARRSRAHDVHGGGACRAVVPGHEPCDGAPGGSRGAGAGQRRATQPGLRGP